MRDEKIQQGKRILVVEDHPESLELLQMALEAVANVRNIHSYNGTRMTRMERIQADLFSSYPR